LEDPDTSPVELGVKFRSVADGFITGVRFYKGPRNTGTHTGSLWSVDGRRLATGTFTHESAQGWQELRFPVPVAIKAATTYIASYHTQVGRYSVDEWYFSGHSVRTGPLEALKSGVSSRNGVYRYGTSGFPSKSYRASNYWIDVTFQSGTAMQTDTTLWTAADVPEVREDPEVGSFELGMRFRSHVDGEITGIRFYKGAANTGTHTGSLWSDDGRRLATGTFTDETASGWQEMTFASPVPINAGTTYVASYHTDVGRYAVTEDYFSGASRRTGALEALEDGNGVYAEGAGFPTRSHRASNYWVDVRLRTTRSGLAADVGTLGGAASVANGVNADGLVVGSSTTAPGQLLGGYGTHAFSWERGTIRDLGALSTGPQSTSQATDVNDQGLIVGDSITANGERHAVVWAGRDARDLGTLGGTYSTATGVNDLGDVVGVSTTGDGKYHAFLWRRGTMTDLGTLGGSTSWAGGINDRGQVAGYARLKNEETHAVLWERGHATDLGGFPDGSASQGTGVLSVATDVSSTGLVIGWGLSASGAPPATWSGGQLSGLTPVARNGTPARVDDNGLIVGSARAGGNLAAIVWWDGSATDLGTLGGNESAALGVANGLVVGRSTTSDGQVHATIWLLAGIGAS